MPLNPTPSDSVIDYIRSLERRISELEGKTLENVVVRHGGISVQDGGSLRVVDTNGVALFYVGQLFLGETEYQGYLLRRPDNTRMFYTAPASNGAMYWAWIDGGEQIMMSNDAASGEGLARPYLSSHGYRSRYQSWEATTSGSFETLWQIRHVKQHPKIRGRVYHTTDASGTTGEWQVVDSATGTVLASGSIGFAQTSQNWGPVTALGPLYGERTIAIQARRTGGTGNVRLEHVYTMGVQS